MRPCKKTTLILVLGLLLTAFSAGAAQTSPQTDQKKATETESCCCCSGDSCDMKMKHDAKMKDHKSDCCNAKQKAKNKQAA